MDKRLWVDQQTHDLVMKRCVAEFRTAHPELDKVTISQKKIVYELAMFYLKTNPVSPFAQKMSQK